MPTSGRIWKFNRNKFHSHMIWAWTSFIISDPFGLLSSLTSAVLKSFASLVKSQYSLTGTKFEQKWNLLKWLAKRLSMHRKKVPRKKLDQIGDILSLKKNIFFIDFGVYFPGYLFFKWKLKVCHACMFGICHTYVYDWNRHLSPISTKSMF